MTYSPMWHDANTPIAERFTRPAPMVPVHADRPATLYQLTDAFLRVTEHLEDDRYTVEDVVAELTAIAGDIRTKGEALARVVTNLDGNADKCDDEAKRLSEQAQRLKDRARRHRAHSEWLRSYAMDQLKALGLDRLDTPLFTLSIRTNPPACTVVDASAVPHEFARMTLTVDVDKRAVLEHYRTTGEVPAGLDITRSQRLDVK